MKAGLIWLVTVTECQPIDMWSRVNLTGLVAVAEGQLIDSAGISHFPERISQMRSAKSNPSISDLSYVIIYTNLMNWWGPLKNGIFVWRKATYILELALVQKLFHVCNIFRKLICCFHWNGKTVYYVAKYVLRTYVKLIK